MTWEASGALIAIFYVFLVMPASTALATWLVLRWLLSPFLPTQTRIENTHEFYSDRR